MEQFQELIGNLTVEQFTRFIGLLLWCAFLLVLGQSFAAALVDGWLFRKGALYYGSLRYLNKCFKSFKSCSSKEELDILYSECRSSILLLRFQRVIPKIMYERLLIKLDQINFQTWSNLTWK